MVWMMASSAGSEGAERATARAAGWQRASASASARKVYNTEVEESRRSAHHRRGAEVRERAAGGRPVLEPAADRLHRLRQEGVTLACSVGGCRRVSLSIAVSAGSVNRFCRFFAQLRRQRR